MSLTPAQLELRRQGTGGSEIGAVAGLNPYFSPLEVYLAKVGDPAPMVETDAMWLGSELEEPLARLYARRTGALVEACGTIIHPTAPFILATPDRLVTLPNGERGVLEVKTSAGWRSADEWGTEFSDEVPGHYIAQTLWEMAVTGLDWADIIVLLHGRPKFYRVRRDNALINMLAEANETFWREHVLKRIPPAPDGSDAYSRHLHERFRENRRPELLASNQTVNGWAEAYREACRQEEKAEAAKKLARQNLEVFIGDASGVEGPWGRITWKARAPERRIDWELVAVEAEVPAELIEKHTKTTPGPRVFRPTWRKERA